MSSKQTVQEWLDANEDKAIVVYDKAGNPVGVKVNVEDKRTTEEVKNESRGN